MARRKVFRTILVLCGLPVVLMPTLVLARTTTNSNAKTNTASVIKQSLPAASNVLNGGGVTSAVSGATSVVSNYLPSGTSQAIQQAEPLVSGLASGNLNTSSLLTTGSSYLTKLLGQGTGSTVSSAIPIVNQLLSGNTSAGSLLSSASGLISNLLGSDSSSGSGSIFGTAASIIGSLFGGSSSSSIALTSALSNVFPDATTSALSDQVFGIDSTNGTGSTNNNTILAQTGTVLCLYNSNCVQSNPTAYRSVYSAAAGAMGFSDPNQVRGQISQLSESGVMPDAFASRFNQEQNNYYMGNYTDREITRAKSAIVLSTAAQTAQKKAILAAQQTAQTLTKLSDQCAKDSKSSQELIRCTMQIDTAAPSFQAAQIALETHAQADRNLQSTVLGNISSSIDGLNRQQDVVSSHGEAVMFKEFNRFSTEQKLAVVGLILLLYGFSFGLDYFSRSNPNSPQPTQLDRRPQP
jgi:hypothetical protein